MLAEGGEVDYGFTRPQAGTYTPPQGGGIGALGGSGMEGVLGMRGMQDILSQMQQGDRGGPAPAGIAPPPRPQAPPSMQQSQGQSPFAFNNVPNPNNLQAPDWHKQAMGGGQQPVGLQDDSFVVDARTVSELGNGSSSAGQEYLARFGGQPIMGSGDGVSDDVPAQINGSMPARVARDEVLFSPNAVRYMGGGNIEKGANKLYALMDKAHKSRQKARRGQDTKLAKKAM